MKRDMNLVKELLFYVETNSTPGELLRNVEIDDYSYEEISYHIKLLVQSGLLEGRSANIDQLFLWYAGDITWQGHEFLSAIRNETVWSKIKTKSKMRVELFHLISLKL